MYKEITDYSKDNGGIRDQRTPKEQKVDDDIQTNTRGLRMHYLKRFLKKGWCQDQVYNMILSGEYKLNKRLKESAINAVEAMFDNLPSDYTPFEFEKEFGSTAQQWADNLGIGVAPENTKDEDLASVTEADMSWTRPAEANAAEIFLARENKKREDEWRVAQSKTLQAKGPSYCVAKFSLGKKKINYDSRKKMWGRNSKTGKPVKIPSLAIWTQPAMARVFIMNEIITRYYGKRLEEKIGTPTTATLTQGERQEIVDSILDQHGLRLTQSTAVVPRVHDSKKGGFYCIYFTLEKHLNQPTKYRYDDVTELNKRSNETITASDAYEEDVQRIVEGDHINGYELQDIVLSGKADEADNPIKNSGLEEKASDKTGDKWRGVKPVDMLPGHAAYLQMCRELEREELAEFAADPTEPEYHMTLPMASLIFEGMMFPKKAIMSDEDCLEVWGEDYFEEVTYLLNEEEFNLCPSPRLFDEAPHVPCGAS
tara:strand:- start:21131 stop:22576 length:1446 start_codon:yes stop_codon:yes gene_type:complete